MPYSAIISDYTATTVGNTATDLLVQNCLNRASCLMYLSNTGAALTEFKIYGKTRNGSYIEIVPACTDYTTAQTLASGSVLAIFFSLNNFSTIYFTAKCATTTALSHQAIITDIPADEENMAAIVALLTSILADTTAIKTSVQIMDDWDESDRAKVNLIVGQAGVTGGAGAVAANTPRMTLASDDPAVVDLAAIEVLNTAIKTSVEIMDDWDESDRAKVNPIAGQAGIAAGAGAVDALTPRTTLAADDPAVVALQVIDDVVGTHDSVAPTKGNQMGGHAISSLPAPVAAGDFAKFITDLYGKLIIAGYDTVTGYLQNEPSSKALPNADALITFQNASTASADGTAYTNSGQYTMLLVFAKSVATAGGTSDTTDIEIESSPNGTDWHKEQTITGVTIAGAGGIERYAAIVFSKGVRPYWRARTVKNGALDTITTTVYGFISAE